MFLYLLYGYLVFSLLHVIAKIVYKWVETVRVRQALKSIPGVELSMSGKELQENFIRRWETIRDKKEPQSCPSFSQSALSPFLTPFSHEWMTSLLREFKDEKVVKTLGAFNDLICLDKDYIQHFLKVTNKLKVLRRGAHCFLLISSAASQDDFNEFTKVDPDNSNFAVLFHKWLGSGIFTVRHGDAFPKDHVLWHRQRKTAANIFTARNFNDLMTDIFNDKATVRQLRNKFASLMDQDSHTTIPLSFPFLLLYRLWLKTYVKFPREDPSTCRVYFFAIQWIVFNDSFSGKRLTP